MGDIVKFDKGTDLASYADLDAGLGQMLSDTRVGNFEKLLRLDGEGVMAYGADSTPLGATKVAINPLSLRHGWVAWSNYLDRKNEILGEVMVRFSEPKPLQEALPPNVERSLWRPQVSFNVMLLEGPDRGEQLLYKTSAVSALGEAMKLVSRIREQRREAISAKHNRFIPICTIETQTFPTKFRPQRKPVWTVIDWVDPDTDLGELYVAGKGKKSVAQATAMAEASAGIAPRSRRRTPG